MLFNLVKKRQVDVVVEFKDRLTRFGTYYLKKYFELHGVKVEETEKRYVEKLIGDFVSIVINFALIQVRM